MKTNYCESNLLGFARLKLTLLRRNLREVEDAKEKWGGNRDKSYAATVGDLAPKAFGVISVAATAFGP